LDERALGNLGEQHEIKLNRFNRNYIFHKPELMNIERQIIDSGQKIFNPMKMATGARHSLQTIRDEDNARDLRDIRYNPTKTQLLKTCMNDTDTKSLQSSERERRLSS